MRDGVEDIAYRMDALSSNSMKSANPHSGFHRIEAAHRREVAELKSKMNDVVCENEALRDACGTCGAKREVAELKHWIKSAARWIKCHDIYHTSGGDLIKQAKEILNDDGEFLFKKGEQ